LPDFGELRNSGPIPVIYFGNGESWYFYNGYGPGFVFNFAEHEEVKHTQTIYWSSGTWRITGPDSMWELIWGKHDDKDCVVLIELKFLEPLRGTLNLTIMGGGVYHSTILEDTFEMSFPDELPY
jgi:hypothetical protein